MTDPRFRIEVDLDRIDEHLMQARTFLECLPSVNAGRMKFASCAS